MAYRPGNAKGCIEIQDYRSHARDIEAGRFKDLCMKQALLALDDWLFLPIAYLSIREDPGVCKQLVLSFVGKFLSNAISSSDLHWAEAETLRFAKRLLRPFTPAELADHLVLSKQHEPYYMLCMTERCWKSWTVDNGIVRSGFRMPVRGKEYGWQERS